MIIRGDEPIIIIRRTQSGVDQYGEPIFSTEEILIRDGLFAFNGSDSPVEVNRNPKDVRLTLYLPHGTEIRDGDIFDIRETHWVQDGTAEDWATIDGFEAGVVVSVRKRNG